ncbi:MAG: AMP-binding protein [Bacteroidales bacterium]
MNFFDYLFQHSSALNKDFILGAKETISYKKLYTDSLSLSKYLYNTFGENHSFIIVSENSVFFTLAYLAVLKSGNICIPLNPALETNSFKQILTLTEPSLAFVSKKYQQKFINSKLTILNEEFVNKITEGFSNKNHDENTTPFISERLAEIIFTSGSTGEQKGVKISHKNLIANTRSIVDYLRLTNTDIIQIVMPFYYCYGLSLLHTHLRAGGSVVFNNSFLFIGSVINDLNKYKCTGFSGVPSHFQILLRKTRDFKNTKFPHLRYVTQAGGKLHNAFIREFVEAFPTIDFIVMYGQTEATARLSYLEPGLVLKKLGSIGKAIPGVTLKVVDKDGSEVLPGNTGEIIASGDNIMLGYFKDETSTRVILKNGWLHTGDIGTIDEDGYIYIKSRKKEIFKVRGIRISPKEIEEVIVSFPGVIDCTIESEYDELTGEGLKATIFINATNKDDFKAIAIQEYCSKHLANHKIPNTIIFDTTLSFNAAGKKQYHKPN